MKVLVTGATGGLGELVIKNLLDQKITVVATARDENKAKTFNFYPHVTFIPYDISQPGEQNLFEMFGKPDTVIHLAWEKLNEYNSPLHTTSILENQKKFIDNLVQNGLTDFNGIGTCYEYGVTEGILEEQMESKPVLPYPEGKNLLRQHLENQQQQLGFLMKWIRVFYVFGEVKGRKNLYTHLLNAITNREETFNMSGGQQIRDFLSPSEVAEIIVGISLQKNVTGIINCCSGKPVKLIDLVKSFVEQHHSNLKLNPGFYPYLTYEPMETWGSVVKMNNALNA